MTSDGNHRRTRYTRFAAWLGLCAVVFLQIQIASHATLEHAPSHGHAEICEVCLKLDKSGSVPLAVAAATAVENDAIPPVFSPAPSYASRTKRPQSARGPPAA